MLKAIPERGGRIPATDVRVLRLASIRFLFGLAQITGASASAILLCTTGVSPETLAATSVTTAITLTSVVLFRVRRRSQ